MTPGQEEVWRKKNNARSLELRHAKIAKMSPDELAQYRMKVSGWTKKSQKKLRQENPEEARRRDNEQKSKPENRLRRNEKSKEYYQNNKVKHRETGKRWYQENQAKANAINLACHHRKKEADNFFQVMAAAHAIKQYAETKNEHTK